MSSVKYLSTPPQTYSRLFRPWDGKTHQDNTITSTTPQSTSSLASMEPRLSSTPNGYASPSDKISRSDVRKIGSPAAPEVTIPTKSFAADELLEKIKKESTSPFRVLSPEQLGKPDVLPPPPASDYLSSPFYPANPYNEFLVGGGQHAVPFIGIDPFLGTMEQEYARVLAEEAQLKMMTARKQRPKKFKCPHCDVAFSNNGQLKGHVRIHTGKCC